MRSPGPRICGSRPSRSSAPSSWPARWASCSASPSPGRPCSPGLWCPSWFSSTRASLYRALLLDPPLLLMDEPFGALDAMTRDEMNVELLRVWGEAGGRERTRKTVLFVTHSIPEAIFLADRVVVMTARPGRVARIFTLTLPRPRTVETRGAAEFGRLGLEIYQALGGAGPG